MVAKPGIGPTCSHAGRAARLNPDVLSLTQSESESGLQRLARKQWPWALNPDQGAVGELELVGEGTRLTYKSTGCEPPEAFSRLAMRARISRRVRGSTGYNERGSKRLDCLRPEETFRGVRTG